MRRMIVTATASAFTLAAAAPSLAQTSPDRDAMWHMGWGWSWGGMIFGPLVMLVFLAGIVVVAVLVVHWLGAGGHGRGTATPRRTPLEILRERFARGEIDKQEYEDRERVLKGEG